MVGSFKFIDKIISETNVGDTCNVYGRITSIRDHGKISFIEIADRTAELQIVIEKGNGYDSFLDLIPGSFIRAEGTLGNIPRREGYEIRPSMLEVISEAKMPMQPNPFSLNGINPSLMDLFYQYPFLADSNPQRMAIIKVMHTLQLSLHEYADMNEFILVHPPSLTNRTLYSPQKAIAVSVNDEDLYLTQCATFELEALAMSLGKVYTISDAFRAELGGSKRHLGQYTHVKFEELYADMDRLMFLAADSLHYAFEAIYNKNEADIRLLNDSIRRYNLAVPKKNRISQIDFNPDLIHPDKIVYITYDEGLEIVHAHGSSTPWGKDLSEADEKIITRHCSDRYVFVMEKPFEAEGFPYRRKPGAEEYSLTADLIAPHGAGEMVGIAEKIFDPYELLANLDAKGKLGEAHAMWYDYIIPRFTGMPPHGGIGAAPQRIIYGILNLSNIQMTEPRPRTPDRKVNHDLGLNPWKNNELQNLIDDYGLE
ncbi:MAG: OB-fold nucleic acid binding domain-containing protein [Candidatus Woesearchaeota archaeon]|nr:OB-fold nucleic acid binding domain-containing protein [Candidatus Woesearchaeota archaeon]